MEAHLAILAHAQKYGDVKKIATHVATNGTRAAGRRLLSAIPQWVNFELLCPWFCMWSRQDYIAAWSRAQLDDSALTGLSLLLCFALPTCQKCGWNSLPKRHFLYINPYVRRYILGEL